MINLSKLCVHPVSIRDIYLPTGWNLPGLSQKCISADFGRHFPETMSSLVGRGLARSSRNLLNASAFGAPSNLVCAAKNGVERITVKGFEHCQHLNFSSSCSAGARLYTERHEWVTSQATMFNFFQILCQRWVERDGAEARVGITQYAADALGDVVFAELPEQGRQVMLFIRDDLCPSEFHNGMNNMQCLPNLVAFMA